MSFVKPRPAGFNDGTRLFDTELDSFQDQLVKAIDGYDGGNYTLSSPLVLAGSAELSFNRSGPITVDGSCTFTMNGAGDLDVNRHVAMYDAEFDGQATVNAGVDFEWTSTTNLPKIGSREYRFTQPLIAIPQGNLWTTAPPKWSFLETAGEWVQADADNVAGYVISFPLTRMPNKATLTSVAILIKGAGAGGGSHGALPANLPKATLYRRAPGSGAVAVGSLVTDNPGTAGNYDTEHCLGSSYPASWTWTGLTEVITYNAYYWVVINGEYGANHADNALSVTHLECAFTCTEIAPG